MTNEELVFIKKVHSWIKNFFSDNKHQKFSDKNKLFWILPIVFLGLSLLGVLSGYIYNQYHVGFLKLTEFIICGSSLYFCFISFNQGKRINHVFFVYAFLVILYNPIINLGWETEARNGHIAWLSYNISFGVFIKIITLLLYGIHFYYAKIHKVTMDVDAKSR